METMQGKRVAVLGVANDHSIAWAIAQRVMEEGAACGFTHLPDRPDDERQRDGDEFLHKAEVGVPDREARSDAARLEGCAG